MIAGYISGNSQPEFFTSSPVVAEFSIIAFGLQLFS